MNALRVVGLIASREIRSLYLQPLAWIVLAAIAFFGGVSFVTLIRSAAYGVAAVEAQHFLFVNLLFWLPLMVALPLIAMRLVTEERQAGTLETLLTAPVTENQVVVAKFVAGLVFYATLLIPFPLYVAIIDAYGVADWGAALGGLLALLLVGSLLLSAAMCASALAEHQIVAALVGFVVVLLIHVGPLLGEVYVSSGWLAGVLDHVNLWRVVSEMASGEVSSRRLVYPLSASVFFLFASARLLEATRGR